MQAPIEELRKNYKRLSDDVLIKIATTEAAGLRPEAIQVIHEEIRNRRLSEGLIGGMEIQTKELSEVELLAYCELIRQQACPVCNSSSQKLNAIITYTVIGYVILTGSEDKLIIACPNCLEKKRKDAMRKTAFFGWWGFPKGFFYTISALLNNKKMSKQTHLTEPSDYLKHFVLNNIGKIETNKRNADQLFALISKADS
jgi:hypothetical protein